jgi:hypothetical protein
VQCSGGVYCRHLENTFRVNLDIRHGLDSRHYTGNRNLFLGLSERKG